MLNMFHINIPINMYIKFVFNAQYQYMKRTNYEWMNFAQFSLLIYKMLNLWYKG
jgi:hypothetical protein